MTPKTGVQNVTGTTGNIKEISFRILVGSFVRDPTQCFYITSYLYN